MDFGEVATFQTLITNTTNYTLPYLIFDDTLPQHFAYIFGTGVLTAPDGIIPAGSGVDAPPNTLRARIDVPIRPGTIITATFQAQLVQSPFYTISGSTASGPTGYVFDEYFAALRTIPAVLLPFGPTQLPTPTPTATTPIPTSTSLPALRPRIHLPLVRK